MENKGWSGKLAIAAIVAGVGVLWAQNATLARMEAKEEARGLMIEWLTETVRGNADAVLLLRRDLDAGTEDRWRRSDMERYINQANRQGLELPVIED